jgi:[protein-PII] uridylyltransferase
MPLREIPWLECLGYHESMSAGLPAIRQNYAERWEEARSRFMLDRDAGLALSALTDATDEVIERVYRSHGAQSPLGLLAIGGYGRRELYPFSDVDLLFVYDTPDKELVEKAITSILHDLWDSKLHVSHQVWGVDELRALAIEDFEFVLALLNGRNVAGDAALGRLVLDEILPEFLDRRSIDLIGRVVEATQIRHASYRETIYQLEPDIKQSPGGLRDYLTGKWLLRLGGPVTFFPYSESEIEGAHLAMARLRILLHFLRGRLQNQLTHRMQEEIARALGYSEQLLQSGVESIMMEYFLNARILNAFCRKTIEKARAAPGRAAELELQPGATVGSLEKAVELFRRSIEEGLPLGDGARTAIVEALPSISQTISFPQLRPVVRELFKPRPGLYRALADMYELGLLDLLFPEFGSIKARVVRDFYHKYTVDEHSLLAIKSVEELLSDVGSDGRFRSLLQDSADGDLLTIALLLHDIGKSREGAHVDRSAGMAARALRRFQFGREEMDTVLFLIRNHLAMSSVVFRRDLEDPEVVRRFVDIVNEPERLRLLCLLTYADIKAVGPGTLNQWKKDLLWQLYVAAYKKLTLGYGEERVEDEDVGERLLAGLPPDQDVDEFERFLEGLPKRYLMATPASEIYEHFALASRLSPENPVQVSLTDRGGYYELCTVTPDRFYLFAKIVGLLSYFEMNILRGYGFSNRRNTVVDLFHFHDTRRVFALNPEERERFLELLTRAVRDEVSVESRLASKEQSLVFRPVGPAFPPTVRFEEEYADTYSIMEIVAPDSIGLLYRIGREISELKCNIELVLISTEGNKAVDVFYLTYQGAKLSPELRERLHERIVTAIG